MGGGSYPASQTPCQCDTNQETSSPLTITNRGNPPASDNLAPRISQIRLQPPIAHAPKYVLSAPHRLIVTHTSQRATSQPPRSGASESAPRYRDHHSLGHLQSYLLGWLRPGATVDTQCNQVSYGPSEHVIDTFHPNTYSL